MAVEISSQLQPDTKGPIIHPAQCAAQVFLLVSARRIFLSFVRPWACWSKKEVCSGALLAHCYFEEWKMDCAIDQLKPSLKSMAQYFFFVI